jgi:hypothetical protein
VEPRNTLATPPRPMTVSHQIIVVCTTPSNIASVSPAPPPVPADSPSVPADSPSVPADHGDNSSENVSYHVPHISTICSLCMPSKYQKPQFAEILEV